MLNNNRVTQLEINKDHPQPDSEDIDKMFEIKAQELQESVTNIIISLVVSMIVLIVIAVCGAIKMATLITKPLIEIKDLAKRFSKYDFSEAIKIRDKTELGQTAEALNIAQQNVKELITNISSSAIELSASTGKSSRSI